ncbi:MAG TPA: DinB family protein [Pyrinomonadaceae bacterium]|nr:DinB family protein [Pyrinomonadaceae bacterium]
MAIENVIGSWKEVRSGLIDEAAQIPAEQFEFQAAANTRSIKGLLQHLVETQKFLVGEVCRPDTNLLRGSFAEQIKVYAPDVRNVNDKDGLLNLLRASMDESGAKLLAAGDEMKKTMTRFDGKQMTKLAFVSFAIAHEMYHRGQLTVYERLLGIEPALTQRFRKAFGETPP